MTCLEHIKGSPSAARLFLVEMTGISREADSPVSDSLDEFGGLLLDVRGRRLVRDGPTPLLLKGVVACRHGQPLSAGEPGASPMAAPFRPQPSITLQPASRPALIGLTPRWRTGMADRTDAGAASRWKVRLA